MQFELVERKPLRVVGLHTKFIGIMSPDANNSNVIPMLWEAFVRVFSKIKHRVGDNMFGVVWRDDIGKRTHPDELNYMAAVEVGSFDGQPGDFVSREVAGGTYAKFVHAGSLASLKATVEAIYQTLPPAGLEHAGIADIEVYDRRFNPDSAKSEFDILVSVRKKK